MKLSRLLFAVITLAVALLFTFAVSTAIASTAKKAAEPPPVDTRKLIKSVNAADGTIVIENMRDKSMRTYKIDDITEIKLNGTAGKIGQIKAGMEVTDSVERDAQTLDSLTLQGYGAEPTAAKPKTTKPKPKPTPTPTPSQT